MNQAASPPALPPCLRIERRGPRLAVLTLDRPEVLNALSMQLRRAIVEAFSTLAVEGVDVVILTGAGRAFCAGLDLEELSAGGGTLTPDAQSDPVAAVRDFPGVVVGAINGLAVTGGFELALGCDILIASDEAWFADTHAHLGVLPGWQLSQRLVRIIGPARAKQVCLAGRRIDAQLAADWGLVSEVAPAGALAARAVEVAEAVLTVSPAMLRAEKQLIDDGYALSFGEAVALEAKRSSAHNRALGAGVTAERRAHVQARNRGASV